MSSGELTDEALVIETLTNKETFSYIIERYEPKLRRYLSRITNVSAADIDDLLQETFIKAYTNLNSFDASFPFSSWMYRIARNVAISEYRKRKVRPEALIIDSDDVMLYLKDETDIERELVGEELKTALANVIPCLREEYREVIVLKYFEDKSYDEMSDIMMKPPGTIATLLSRAKKELKERLQAQEHTQL